MGKKVQTPEEMHAIMRRYSERLTESPETTLDRFEEFLLDGLTDHIEPETDSSQPSDGMTHYVEHGGEVHSYCLRPGVPADAQARIEALSQIRLLRMHCGGDGNPGFFMRAAISLGQITSRIQDFPLLEAGVKSKKRAAKGGAATRKLTEDQVEMAREIFESFAADGLSKTEQGNRAVAKLKKTHGIEISQKTLARSLAE